MNTGLCITNMITTRQGEHCLFRSFGLGAVTDRIGGLRRSDLSNAVAKWYPQVKEVSIKQRDDGAYDVTVKGGGE